MNNFILMSSSQYGVYSNKIISIDNQVILQGVLFHKDCSFKFPNLFFHFEDNPEV